MRLCAKLKVVLVYTISLQLLNYFKAEITTN